MLLFESFKSIKSICKKYKIKNYTINPDGTVDVDGDVYLLYKELTEIPLKFGRVTGDFDCGGNYLSSLEGAPYWVGGGFYCAGNKLDTLTLEGSPKCVVGQFNCNKSNLTSLEGAPKKVGAFSCSSNKLTTLKGSPEWVGGHFFCCRNKLTTLEEGPKSVGGDFSCSWNKLTSLEGSPEYVGGYFDCDNNQLTSLEGGPKKIGGRFDCNSNPIHNIFKLFTDYKSYLDSLDYGYLRGTDIVKVRFQEALEEIGKELPESIEGYKYI